MTIIGLGVAAIAMFLCAGIFIFAKKDTSREEVPKEEVETEEGIEGVPGEDWSWTGDSWLWHRGWYKWENREWVEWEREEGQWFGSKYGLWKAEEGRVYTFCADNWEWYEVRCKDTRWHISIKGKWRKLDWGSFVQHSWAGHWPQGELADFMPPHIFCDGDEKKGR